MKITRRPVATRRLSATALYFARLIIFSLGLARATVLLSAVFFCVAGVTAAEPIVFYPAYAPGPADNPLKGGRSFRFANVDQDRDRVGWLTLGKIVVP